MGDQNRVIAEREYSDQEGNSWLLQVFEPVRYGADQTDRSCGFRLLTPEGEETLVTHAVGIDGVQALLFALIKAGDVLATEAGRHLTYLGMTNLDLPRTSRASSGAWQAVLTGIDPD